MPKKTPFNEVRDGMIEKLAAMTEEEKALLSQTSACDMVVRLTVMAVVDLVGQAGMPMEMVTRVCAQTLPAACGMFRASDKRWAHERDLAVKAMDAVFDCWRGAAPAFPEPEGGKVDPRIMEPAEGEA